MQHNPPHTGPKGEGGLDDATGAGGSGGASMKQSSGTVDLGMPHFHLVVWPAKRSQSRFCAAFAHCLVKLAKTMCCD